MAVGRESSVIMKIVNERFKFMDKSWISHDSRIFVHESFMIHPRKFVFRTVRFLMKLWYRNQQDSIILKLLIAIDLDYRHC